MGLFDEVMAVSGLAGSAQSSQHAGALSAIMEYVNSPQVGGPIRTAAEVSGERSRGRHEHLNWNGPELAHFLGTVAECPAQRCSGAGCRQGEY